MEETISSRFVSAWLACKNPEMDGTNPYLKNKYATLKATLEVIRDACKEAEIMYQQSLVKGERGYTLESRVVSKDGESLELSCFPVETPPNPQSFGSNLTYAKRQQAQADWGITGEEDDDGNAAAGTAQATNKHQANNYTKKQKTTPQNAEGKRKAWIAKALQLKADCVLNGVKEASLDAWYMNKFGDVQPVRLTEQELTEWGQYLAQIAKDSKAMKEAKNESKHSND